MSTLSENTKVKLGLVLGMLVMFIGCGTTGAGVIWWASAVQSKLDTVNATLKSLEVLTAKASAATVDIDKNAAIMSERVAAKFESLERRVAYLEGKFPVARQ